MLLQSFTLQKTKDAKCNTFRNCFSLVKKLSARSFYLDGNFKTKVLQKSKVLKCDLIFQNMSINIIFTLRGNLHSEIFDMHYTVQVNNQKKKIQPNFNIMSLNQQCRHVAYTRVHYKIRIYVANSILISSN